KEQIPSIKRIEGQVRGIKRMIESEEYCIDILNQLKAAKNAISTVEGKILRNHLQACVKEALVDEQNFDKKVDELIKTLKR
uniref:metal-sensitive transcriptional regulator n=1 Tax=Winogradskyella sp. TaxID=1883156 RepID=UPI0035142124